jgi:pimeloyl-ACP methyl ester carboxylesterase
MLQPNGVKFATVHLTTGLSLHYAEQGDPAGEAIVFLHAYVDSWFTFSRMLPLLSPSYHAFAVDQRGHGGSDKPECCYTVDDFTADVDVFMEAVGTEEATLVGSSSAGLIAQRVALNYPHRVSRLVLVGSPTMLVNNETVIEAEEEFCSRWKIPSQLSSLGSFRRAPSTTRCRMSSSIRWSQRASSSRLASGALTGRRWCLR